MANQKQKKVKGFKPETINKIVKDLHTRVNSFTEQLNHGKDISICVSNGNSKIGKCMNVSLAPILTCGNCKECKYFCYDVKACLQYENVRIARAKNTAIFKYSRKNFFEQLWKKMSRKKTNKFLRFHVSGEIMDINHLEWIIETARRFPDFKIWTYTKMYHVINEYIRQHGENKKCIPANLKIMFSEWKGLPIINPYGMPVFRCINPDEQPPKGFTKCPGNCDICKANNTGCVAGRNKYVLLH